MAIDNSYVVGALQRVASGWRPGPKAKHGEAWVVLFGCPAGVELLTSGRVRVVKIKSHLSKAQATAAGHTEACWEANRLADFAADAAADRAERGPGDLRVIRKLDEAAAMVCRRTGAVGKYVVDKRAPLQKTAAVKQRPLRIRLMEIGTSAGHSPAFNAKGSTGGIRCVECGQ